MADGFVSHAPGLPHNFVSAEKLLRSEGVHFNPSRHASPSQRFHSEGQQSPNPDRVVARVVTPPTPTGVQIGNTIRARDLDSEQTHTWNLVPKSERGPACGKLSVASPIGRALLGREIGDTIAVAAPRGIRRPLDRACGAIARIGMPLFDRYIAMDWSANSAPKSGQDSIWSCLGECEVVEKQTVNHRTRHAAEAWLLGQLTAAVFAGKRVLVGLDFPYGYPAGFAAALGLDGEPWRATWAYLERQVSDNERNLNNRFEVAAAINQQLGRHAPFWGRPAHRKLPTLPFQKRVAYLAPQEFGGLSEWRQVEEQLRSWRIWPHSVWKLAGAGAVGSQALMGIPVVNRMRHHDLLRGVSRVWPFEIAVPNLPVGSPAVVHAEIWPTIVPFEDEAGSCSDEQQVRAVVRHWRELDQKDYLAALFAEAPDDTRVRREEGWTLGVPSSGTILAPAPRRARLSAPTQSTPGPLAAATASVGRPSCLCGCGDLPRGRRSRFMPGHDQRISPATGRPFNAH